MIRIIAEAGVNHNGDISIAKKLVDAAKACGADIVKFQTFSAEKIASKNAAKADYQIKSTESGESQFEMLKRLELDERAHREIKDYCDLVGVEFLSTPFDTESVDMLSSLGVHVWKIPSGEITNLPFLRKIGSMDQEIILSSGMANLGEIEAALESLEAAGTSRDRITLLHCTTEYPAPYEEVNLGVLGNLSAAFGIKIGYSDHTKGISIPLAAAALGATIIEKHFTLDRSMTGPDHAASLEPDELSAMIAGIREIEIAMGDGIKRPTASELRNRNIARKSIVAAKRIARGEIFTDKNLTTKRPGHGISPMLWDSVLGRTAVRDFVPDEAIEI